MKRGRDLMNEGEELADVIDLIPLPRSTRPIPIAYLDYDEIERCRQMACTEYAKCLAFAARVRWKSFHCRQCPHAKESTKENMGEAAVNAPGEAKAGPRPKPCPAPARVIPLRSV